MTHPQQVPPTTMTPIPPSPQPPSPPPTNPSHSPNPRQINLLKHFTFNTDFRTTFDPPTIIIDPSTLPPSTYTRTDLLGKGGYAKCYKLISASKPTPLACKISNTNRKRPVQREKLSQEVTIHSSMSHPNIVRFHSSFTEGRFHYILMEYCDNGTLMDLSRARGAITEPEAGYFIRQICNAVVYMHEERSVIHHDIKLANIFLSGMVVKVGDFGLATYHDPRGGDNMTCLGTPNYLAPEVLSKSGHSFEADIWSIGCLLYTLLIGYPPFQESCLTKAERRIKSCEYNFPDHVTLSTYSTTLIKRLLQLDRLARPSAREILDDEFFKKINVPDTLDTCSLTCTPPQYARPEIMSEHESTTESSSDDGEAGSRVVNLTYLVRDRWDEVDTDELEIGEDGHLGLLDVLYADGGSITSELAAKLVK